jgi:hypothetical protein
MDAYLDLRKNFGPVSVGLRLASALLTYILEGRGCLTNFYFGTYYQSRDSQGGSGDFLRRCAGTKSTP